MNWAINSAQAIQKIQEETIEGMFRCEVAGIKGVDWISKMKFYLMGVYVASKLLCDSTNQAKVEEEYQRALSKLPKEEDDL